MSAPDPMKSPRCSATSKQTGRRCGLSPVRGATVCRFHGGAAPQVQRSARQRLAELAEPAIEALRLAIESDDTAATVRASVAVLDRTGYGPRDHTVALSLPKVETPAGVVAALAALLEQVAAGSVSPASAGEVAELLRAQRDSLALTIIEERLAAIETDKGRP